MYHIKNEIVFKIRKYQFFLHEIPAVYRIPRYFIDCQNLDDNVYETINISRITMTFYRMSNGKPVKYEIHHHFTLIRKKIKCI